MNDRHFKLANEIIDKIKGPTTSHEDWCSRFEDRRFIVDSINGMSIANSDSISTIHHVEKPKDLNWEEWFKLLKEKPVTTLNVNFDKVQLPPEINKIQ